MQTYLENNDQRPDPQENQRFVVQEIFKSDFEDFVSNKSRDTWCNTWDGAKEAYISADTIYHMARRIGIIGPLATLMGRLVDYHISTEGPKYNFCIKRNTARFD